MKFTFSKATIPNSGILAILVSEGGKLSAQAESVDKTTSGALKKAMKAAQYTGKKGKNLVVYSPANTGLEAIILVGVGGPKDQESELNIERIGGTIAPTLNAHRFTKAAVLAEKLGNFSAEEVAAHIAYAAKLKAYHFYKYFTTKKADEYPTFKELTLLVTNTKAAEDKFKILDKVADGIYLTRNVVSEPPNVIYPESYAKIIAKELQPLGVKVEILDRKAMEKLGMGALLGVGQGSTKESRLVVMQWKGGKPADKPVAFVGKGVTFDTGGISIKPSDGMGDMKYDMAGSGAVVGAMKALAGRKAKMNVVGVVGLVENMPDGNAIRPSDILHTMSGQTIECLNTDAEGRLVLADALWYTQDRFKPKFIVDLATLTGAITIALGRHYAGLFSNSDDLCDRLTKAGKAVDEKLWRFPTDEAYDRQIDSVIADVQNIGNEKGAGSITASKFLERFVNKTPWAHLDIAGVAWASKDGDFCTKGATAFGVRLLNELVLGLEK
jgi:leucyl aminopeptidase